MTDFSSIDRMMEFGLGLGVARQMSDAMNHALNSMQVPGAGPMPQQPLSLNAATFYAVVGDRVAGPLAEAEFITLIKRGDIDRATLVWRPGDTDWLPLENVPEAYKLLLLNS